MKLVTLSDIHGDLETLDKAMPIIKSLKPDVTFINGDLIGEVFNGEQREKYLKVSELIRNVALELSNATEGKINSIHSAAEVISQGKVNLENPMIKTFAESYLRFEESASSEAKRQYSELKKRFDDLGNVLLVPGNWDVKSIDDIFAKENLHMKVKEVNGIKIAGYGGVRLLPKAIPVDLSFSNNYDEDEAFAFLSKTEAEIALLHNPPRFFEGENAGFPGSHSLLAYLYQSSPSLILTGHTHNLLITQEPQTKTTLINPGLFGRYNGLSYGTFIEVDIDDNLFVKPRTIYRIDGARVTSRDLS